ncbi:MAG: hypothetical protein KC492_09430, partial [Myxococcales bacterium]|nr:hypothetical protein [Myxococcales bacterium]
MSARDKLSGRLRWAISRQIRVFVVAGALAAVALPSGGAQAKKRQGEFDWAGLDQLPAVQNRKYRLQHEFFASGAVLPVDPFTKG